MNKIEPARPMPDHGTPPRFTVRRKTYRGREGFLVYETPHKCDRPICFAQLHKERFFCATYAEAVRMRDECKRGLAPIYDYRIAELIAKDPKWRERLKEAGYDVENATTRP